MKCFPFLAATAVLTASGVHAGFNTAQTINPAKFLARSASIHARQDVDKTTAEFCGSDNAGYDWWCEDPQTTCCFGTDIWQCAPITAQECCMTGYYCEAGTFCYIEDVTQDQYCLTPEEVAIVQDDVESGAGAGARVKPTKSAVAAAAAQTHGSKDGGDDEDSGSKRKKGGSSGGSDENASGADKEVVGRMMVGFVALGALAVVGF